jgi:hypothetical protein
MMICFNPAPFDVVRMLGQAAPSATRNGNRSILSLDGHSAGFTVKPDHAVAFGGLTS